MKSRCSMLMMVLLAVVGCRGDGTDSSICRDGVDLSVGGAAYCVYESSVVIETGFKCPPERPHEYQRGDLVICSDQGDLTDEELDEVRQEYERITQGDPGPDLGLDFDFELDEEPDASDGQEEVILPCDDSPSPVARARLYGSQGEWSSTVQASPLDTVELDGSASFDPDGSVVAYQWEVTEKPTGSRSASVSDPEAAVTLLWLDLAGRYVVWLTVWDDEGNASCTTGEVVILALPCCEGGVHVQLIWDTDETDLDLHLLHPNGTQWGQSPWDCHYANRIPEWGESGTDDDPTLDIDDTDGFGPENINLSSLEGSAYGLMTYRVGVHFHHDYGGGPTTATVRIYLGAVLQFEATGPEMAVGGFWEAAWITGPLGDIDPVDDYTSSTPSATRVCGADSDCPPDSFCETEGACARGCRTDPDSCPDALTCDPEDRVCQ